MGYYLQEPDFVKFMKDPLSTETPQQPPPTSIEDHWVDIDGHEYLHYLGAHNFDTFLENHDSVLVMFYAPCKYHFCWVWIRLRPLPYVLYLEHCIISINNSNFQIFYKIFFLHFNSFENIMENGTFASQEQIFHFS